MINMAPNKEESSKFITNFYLKDDFSKFVIRFADDRIEERKFTFDEMNKVMLEMENQFYSYESNYTESCRRMIFDSTLKSILELLVAVGGIYFTSSINIPNVLKIAIILSIFCYSFYTQKILSLKSKIGSYCLKRVAIIREFLENKESFKIKFLNPKTNQIEDWYLLNLSGIDEIYDSKLVTDLSSIINDDLKEEESLKMTLRFRNLG